MPWLQKSLFRYMPLMSSISKIIGLWLTLTFWAANSYAGDSTEIRQQILKVASQISKNRTVDDRAIGFAGQTSEQYKRFDFLVQQATENELITLTGHENAKVRAYAFWALAKRHYKDSKAILEKHLSDTASFVFFSGCDQGSEQVNHFFLDLLTPNHVDVFCYKLTWQEAYDYYDKMRNATKAKD
jgi:hypothetical protein